MFYKKVDNAMKLTEILPKDERKVSFPLLGIVLHPRHYSA